MTALDISETAVRDERAPETTTEPVTEVRTQLPLPRLLERYGILAVGALAAFIGWTYRWTADDAYINFRAIENLLAGNGMVFNAGQRIEVTTSPLWAYVLAVGGLLPGSDGVVLPWFSVILGLALAVAGVVLACLGCVRLRDGSNRAGLMVPFGALVFLALPPVWDFLTSGLETGLTFGWIGLSWWGLARLVTGDRTAKVPAWLIVVLGLGPLIRPDLAVVTVFLAAFAVLAVKRSWLRRIGTLAIGAILPVGYEIFRMGYYGLLVPNTAVAKESTRALWSRGWTYLGDLVGPYYLWLPGLVVAGVLGYLLWQLWQDNQRRIVALSVTFVVAGAVHSLFVVRVGGDFMHGRMLLPGLMLALVPAFLVPVSRRALRVSLAVLTVVGVWALTSMAGLRVGYLFNIGPSGIADERGYYVRISGNANPITLEDHTAAQLGTYNAKVQELQREGQDVVVAQPFYGSDIMTDPSVPAAVLGPSTGGVDFLVGNAGFFGVGAGLDVTVDDFFGLANPVGSHMEPPIPGRPGHEKQIPLVYMIAMYGEGDFEGAPVEDILVIPGYPQVDPGQVEAARQALTCGDVAELLDATEGRLTAKRFWDNITGAVARTDMRIAYDPEEQVRRTC